MTLLGQMITFAIFVWFTMRFVWPHITQALEERQKKIADGLAAAERGQHELVLAQEKAVEQLRSAKSEAGKIIEMAHQRADQIVTEAKDNAKGEAQRLIDSAESEIARGIRHAREAMQQEVAKLTVLCAEKLLSKQIDAQTNHRLVDQLIQEVVEQE